MEEKQVHYYNVIAGKCACGAPPANLEAKDFSVFTQNVTCPECLAALKGVSGKSDGKSG